MACCAQHIGGKLAARITSENPYFLLGWAASRLGLTEIWPPESIPLASVDPHTGDLHAVVIYNAFYNNSCVMHIASAKTRKWATRETLRGFFDLPFNRLGLSSVRSQVRQSNVSAQVLALKLGFSFEGVQKYPEGQDDMVLLGLLKTECKFLNYDNKDAQDAALQQQQREADGNGKTESA